MDGRDAWSHKGYIPSVDVDLDTGMISVAAHMAILSDSGFLNPGFPNERLKVAE